MCWSAREARAARPPRDLPQARRLIGRKRGEWRWRAGGRVLLFEPPPWGAAPGPSQHPVSWACAPHRSA